jgi:hypothetical protein
MSLFVLYMHKASSYRAFSRDNCHLQIGCHKTHASSYHAERINTDIAALSICAWAMYFNGSACGDGCGIGILLVSPRGATYSFSIRLPTACTNNLVEYEAVRKGMELLLEAGAEAL